jgi:hypothetical protein
LCPWTGCVSLAEGRDNCDFKVRVVSSGARGTGQMVSTFTERPSTRVRTIRSQRADLDADGARPGRQFDYSRKQTTRSMIQHRFKAERVRNRLRYGGCLLSVIATGLLWRSSLLSLPTTLSKYGGDALWSLMVFFGLGLLLPHRSTKATAALALLFSFLVETTQLYHAPWIDGIRSTRLGALALGSVFNWPDFPAYVAGVLTGVVLEFALLGGQKPSPNSTQALK